MNPLSDSNNLGEVEAKNRMVLVQWLNSVLPSLNIPINSSDGELRTCLSNGTVLCQILNKLRPGSVNVVNDFYHSLPSQSENVKRFLAALDLLGLPKFEILDLEKGNMKSVVDCLLTLRAKSLQNAWGDNGTSSSVVRPLRNVSSNVHFTDQRKVSSETTFQRIVRSPVMPEHVGSKIHDVFQLKHGSYSDLPEAKISELMKSTNLDNAPTQSLLSVVNGILEESVERRSGEIPQRVACLLRKVVQEIERRISTQAEHLKTQNNLFKTREDKYQSRIRVLEVLASGSKKESENDKPKMEENKADDKDIIRLTKELEEKSMEISTLKQELQNEKTKMEQKMANDIDVIKLVKRLEDKNTEILTLKQELQIAKTKMEENKADDKDVIRLMKELEEKHTEISTLKQELKTEKTKMEQKMANDIDVIKLVKGLEDKNTEISTLKQELHIAKTKMEEKKANEKDVIRLTKEMEDKNEHISTLKQELQVEKTKMEEKKGNEKDVNRLMKELNDKNMEILTLKHELQLAKTKMDEKKGNEEDVNRLTKVLNDKNMENLTLKQEIQVAKTKMDEKKGNEEDVNRLTKDLNDKNMENLTLKQELQVAKTKMDEKKGNEEDVNRLMKDLNDKKMEILTLKQELQVAKTKMDEKKVNEEDVNRLTKELDDKNMEISTLKQELQVAKTKMDEKKVNEEDVNRLTKELDDKNMEILTLKQELQAEKTKAKKADDKNVVRLMKELVDKGTEISTLKQELETLNKTYKVQCSQLEAKANGAKGELEQKSQEYEHMLEKLRNKIKANESMFQKWNIEKNKLHKALTFQFGSIQELRLSWQSIKQDVKKEQMIYAEECNRLGVNIKPIVDTAESYQEVLAENRKLFNEVQDLKGNIRVYCRVRPFIPGQKEKQSIVEHLGETELVVANPSKQGKEALRSFKFNKVFGPASTQAEVYGDIQGFIRSVLDGFNVCIFAYGQTGSGKTYTMSGPNGATNESLGVNYRALNDLFSISTTRKNSIVYDIVPDASMYPVKSTSDVMKLMDIGLKNRAKGSTAMNERSSRSHSVVSIHVRGVDNKAGTSLQGNLHLVDLAGSERVDRSEVIGDRLKEAQHINKSLSALGDVIFALSQKSAHVPYRNSKLTQLLQTSLGGQAKTLMLVQINSELKSFSESVSTLKFAERVSGVELGAARSTKAGTDVKDLMEQIATLKDEIVIKDGEIEQLQLLKRS
ncbi:hypothetical protein TanjilG_05867 [Lupinus angustifolius]|uniref:Kinesin motor domain-containing protein n=1 Tax=Lupinus angustifolius TaxID=3871 RepID=A0A4P1RDR3_LUPAN|nr:hypothetical protein TanjilG_05867 [Lupinus angustifolius]